MKNKLNDLLKNSHSPYSKVKVSAIVVDENNNEYKGVNVENASFGGTICAERAAILNAISNGAKKIKEINLTSSLENPLYPCGICRQFMVETLGPEGIVNIYFKEKKTSTTVKELLPNKVDKGSFGWK